MKKNITLKLDPEILNRVRHVAVDENKSVSAWVSDLIVSALNQVDEYERSRHGALEALSQGLNLGGTPLTRKQLHERP